MRKRNDGHCYSDDKYLTNWWQRSRLADNGCWEWAGPTRKTSEHVDIGFRGTVMLLHRAAYILFFGPISAGHEIHHRCRNARCWRPDHLEALTGAAHDELHRKKPKRTHCQRGHEFTPENSLPRTDGGRNCRICHMANRAAGEKRRQDDPVRHAARLEQQREQNRARWQRLKTDPQEMAAYRAKKREWKRLKTKKQATDPIL